MKKLSLYVFIVFMWCNVGFAETMNKFLDDKYKITKEIIVKFETRAFKIFTLKKGNNVKVCSVRISKFDGISSRSKCVTP